MKNMLFIIVLAAIVGFPAMGGTFGIGAKLGANNAWGAGDGWDAALATKDDVATVMSTGLAGGLYFTYDFNRFIGMQTELLIDEISWGGEGTDSGSSYEVNIYHVSLDIPVLAKGMLPLWKGSFFLVGGPVFFIPLYKLSTTETVAGVDQPRTETDIDTAFHVGLTLGTGYELYLWKKWCIGFDVRYTRTFTGLLDLPFYEEMYSDIFVFHLYTGLRFGG